MSKCQNVKMSNIFKLKKLQTEKEKIKKLGTPTFQNKSQFQRLRYEKICFKDVPMIFLSSLKYFGDKYGDRGSRFARFFGSSRNHPKSIAICLEITIRHFGIV